MTLRVVDAFCLDQGPCILPNPAVSSEKSMLISDGSLISVCFGKAPFPL